jgi:hypothetical protein
MKLKGSGWRRNGTYIKKFSKELIANSSLIEHGPHIKRCAKQFFYCCMCIRCRGNILPSRCLTRIWGYTYRHKDLWEGFMKYAVELGSDAKLYIPS